MKLFKFFIVFTFVAVSSAEISLDDFQISDYIQVKRNNHATEEARSESTVESFVKNHDVAFKLPILGSTLTFSARNLDEDEVDVKLNFNSVEARGKKSKLKKIFVPIFVFILIKAMVMIPLALGILAIKTWNALQLSFVSFVVALALSVWQMCKKIAGDNAHPQVVAAHNPWESAARSFSSGEAHKMAYSAYVQQ